MSGQSGSPRHPGPADLNLLGTPAQSASAPAPARLSLRAKPSDPDPPPPGDGVVALRSSSQRLGTRGSTRPDAPDPRNCFRREARRRYIIRASSSGLGATSAPVIGEFRRWPSASSTEPSSPAPSAPRLRCWRRRRPARRAAAGRPPRPSWISRRWSTSSRSGCAAARPIRRSARRWGRRSPACLRPTLALGARLAGRGDRRAAGARQRLHLQLPVGRRDLGHRPGPAGAHEGLIRARDVGSDEGVERRLHHVDRADLWIGDRDLVDAEVETPGFAPPDRHLDAEVQLRAELAERLLPRPPGMADAAEQQVDRDVQPGVGIDLELRARRALDGGGERQPCLARPVDAEVGLALGCDAKAPVEADAAVAFRRTGLDLEAAADVEA